MLQERDWQNLYIHVPFCARKCDYCAFYSTDHGKNLMRPWLDRILRDCGLIRKPEEIRTVYFGGGTPTLLEPEILERLLKEVKQCFSSAEEISIECNPESLTEEKAAMLGKYVNRVSVGVQSFDPVLRERIGRYGGIEHIEHAFQLLHKYGLHNTGCDLIYAIPGQTPEEWKSDLERAKRLALTHLSAYSLTVEENTPLSRRYPPSSEQDDLAADLEEIARKSLETAGLVRYEISNYARNGYECRHNQNIWHGETYLGLGPSACSFNGRDRFTQVASVTDWLNGVGPEWDRIPARKRQTEMLIMGLRTLRGWIPGEFEAAAGISAEDLCGKELEYLRRIRMLKADGLALTAYGLDFWNDAAMNILQ